MVEGGDAPAEQNGELKEQKLARLLNSRRAHRGVATRQINQAGTIMHLSEDAFTIQHLKELKTIQKSIIRKLADIEAKNSEVEYLIDDEKLETEILESEDNIAIIQGALDSIAEFIVEHEQASAPQPSQPQTTQVIQVQASSQQNVAANVMKLPKLDLPKFSGDYKQWTSFYDLFKASVDTNGSLSSSQKLHYLKCSLEEDAAKLLSSLTITDDNYDTAKTILEGRFQNKRAIVRAHLQAIYSYPVLKQESSKGLRKLMETVNENRLALQNQTVQLHDAVLVFLLTEKLDPESRRQWELSSTGTDLQTYDALYQWLELRCRALESAPPKEPSTSNNSIPSAIEKKKPAYSYHSSAESCPLCQGEHRVHKCKKFTDMSIEEKFKYSRQNNICYNCLLPGHLVGSCPSKTNCRTWNKRHHSLLHRSVPEHFNQCAAGNNMCSQVLLPTAMVRVKPVDGSNALKCRALLDSGSQMSFISTKTFQRLGLRKLPFRGSLATLGGTQSSSPRGAATVEIVISGRPNVAVDVCILPTVTQNLPQQPIDTETWKIDGRLPLADPSFNVPKEIDILLGSDVYEELVLERKIKVTNGVFLRETVFGWVVSGPGQQSEKLPFQSFAASFQNDIGFDLKKFWETEEVSNQNSDLTPEEQACEKHFDETTFRNKDGRFVVLLPFRNNAKPLGNSKLQAEKRFSFLEKRLDRNPELKTQYSDFIQEYLDLDHLEVVPEQEVDKPDSDVYYLPHHCVLKDSTTTKLRVVFDASAATTNGVSLNDNLMVGPTIQSDLLDILIRFRFHKIAFSADIAKMYRQVLLSDKDKDFHRILWRFKTEDNIKVLRMKVVTYGVASSAYHAVRSVTECGAQNFDELVSPIICNDFYVDNALSGTNDLETAFVTQDKLMDILGRSGFDLRKWSSNAPELIYRLPPSHRETPQAYDLDINSHTVKTLGVVWNPFEDSFAYTVQLPKPAQTRRGILSEISKIYDPLGWLSPVTVKLKCFMQNSWLLPMDWDSVLPDVLQQEWDEMRNSLVSISNLVIERYVLCSGTCDQMDLHVFCDASEVAYSAAVYVRCECSGTVTCKLLAAKTKVSPIKKVSLPRLELCAAVLGAKLKNSVKNALSKSQPNLLPGVFAWSDSTIVLAWISQLPRSWNCYVGNRVSEIQGIIAPTNWRHVPGIVNPADCASRGILADQLRNHNLWWNGPEWLLLSPEHWPQLPEISVADAPERKKDAIEVTTLTVQLVPPVVKLENYSNVSILVRSFAYCLRFIKCLKAKMSVPEQSEPDATEEFPSRSVPEQIHCDFHVSEKPSNGVSEQCNIGPLSPAELICAENWLILFEQKQYFPEDYKALVNGDSVPKRSKLHNLTPFYDKESGLIRVGGRLKQSAYSFDCKHPIIIDSQSKIAVLLIRRAHLEVFHGGAHATLFQLRQSYWMIGAKTAIKKFIKECVPCHRFNKPKIEVPMMANLPPERVTQAFPFEICGLDFGGPLLIKTSVKCKSTFKCYIALFVCFTTKAIHIELVHSLTTEDCISAVKRFIARRGLPSVIYSDNATNFAGARKEILALQEVFRNSKKQSLKNFCTMKKVDWIMIPPRSPHFGGLWEAGIKSVKHHLRRCIGLQVLTSEELSTILCEIEAILNSRPISAVSSDPNDVEALSPGHFLIGRPLLQPFSGVPGKPLKCVPERWHLRQKIVSTFWNRWRKDYLSGLQQRHKWSKDSAPFNVGDLVLLREENVPPMNWAMGRITSVRPGKDGKVRVAEVRTSRGSYLRPVAKMSKMPVH